MRKTLLTSLLLFCCAVLLAQEYGVVNVSVCNTRHAADYDSGQESQALLGMPVKILDRHNEWTQIQTPEDYVHWVLSSCIHRVTRDELSQWNHDRQLVVTSLYGFVYQKPDKRSQTVSDVVGGDRLRLLGKKGKYYQVAYPDGREGYLPRQDGKPLDEWRATLKQDAQSILSTAYSLNGIPYMWGGTSPKGVDCSGFVRTTLYLHDIIIPRNASQQARKGQRIEIAPDYSNLLPGDLLFFGSGTRVSHVGFYVGNQRFIHSLGCVHESSFSPQDPNYDEYDRNRLLFACRFLPYINKEEGLCTTDQNPYYQW